MRRVNRLVLVLAGACALGGCSVSDVLTADELLEEVGEIVRIDGQGEARAVVYASEAELSKDFMRMVALAPIRWPLAWTFGRRSVRAIENPSAHVRALLRELPNETEAGWWGGSDLAQCAAACAWFAWLAELDENPMTRIRCLDGMSQLSQQLGLAPFDGDFADMPAVLDADAERDARAAILAARPEGREGPAPAALEDALAALIARQLPSPAARASLVSELRELLLAEPDPQAREWIAAAARRAMEHCIRACLLRSVTGRARKYAEVRLCGMEQVRRLGGPRSVALLLAVMAASPRELAAGVPAFDRDVLVQLRLIHYCGQLDAERARAVVRLPGRQDWEATSPAEFLARTILSERDYYSQIRNAAIVALTWCLGRPTLDLDAAWVREWLDNKDA